MDDDPAQGVRRKKDSSLVRAAEAVRDGKALAMVSAGNTGAAMASALLRMGRLPSVIRPAIATPIPNPGGPWPTVLLDSGANAECTPHMLVQFAQMGAAFARKRYGIDQPRVALLSIGEEKSKGSPLVKETHALLAEGAGGSGFRLRRQRRGPGLLRRHRRRHRDRRLYRQRGTEDPGGLHAIPDRRPYRHPRPTRARGVPPTPCIPHLLPLAADLDPETTGGAMLLGSTASVSSATARRRRWRS